MHFRARNKHSRFNQKKKKKKKKRKKETIAHFIETYLKLTSVDTTLAWIRLTSASVSTSAICLPFVSSCQVRLHEIERAKKKRRERERGTSYFKCPCWHDVRHEEEQHGTKKSRKSEKKRVNDDVFERRARTGHSYVRREIFIGERKRARVWRGREGPGQTRIM